MKLIIAEKPTVAMTIAKVVGANEKHDGYVEGNGFLVSWCYGHLLTNATPEVYDESLKKWTMATLPIVPKEWKNVPIPSSQKQLMLLKKLIDSKEVDSLIEATDAGREGELIFRLVYDYTKTKKPFERLWISSLEAGAIREGLTHLKPSSDYDNLYQAALARSRADWLFGINGTRYYTLSGCMGNDKATVGRVQTPTLAMIVQREKERNEFVVQKRMAVVSIFNGWKAESEKFTEKEKIVECLNKIKGKNHVVTSVETNKKFTSAPRIFSLTSLQREMNTRFAFSASKTLELVQELYEKKILSYPRTDSEYITSDMKNTAIRIVENLKKYYEITDNTALNFNKIINNDKVSDHYAIIVTETYSKQAKDVTLSKDEQTVVSVVARRMIEAVYPSYCYNETKVQLDCDGYNFSASGNTALDYGWKIVAQKIVLQEKSDKEKDAEKKEENDTKNNVFPPDIAKGKIYTPTKLALAKRDTKPPTPYTEASLLAAMEKAGAKDMEDDVERKGLGTSATRAEIIEKLLNRKYIYRKGKSLLPTAEGVHLIDSVSDGFKSVATTVEWENRLLGIEKGKGGETCSDFCQSIENELVTLIKDSQDKDIALKPMSVGKCPWCGGDMQMLGQRAMCSSCGKKIYNHPLWMADGYNLNTDSMKTLLSGKAVYAKLKAKTGKIYAVKASLDFDKMKESPYAEWKFVFPPTKKKK